jgi:N-acetylmuramoyl-L-alanine amidase
MKLITRFKNTLFIALAVAGVCSPVVGNAKPVVILDAAHGGSDSGIKSGSEVEKDWNYRFAQALQKALETEGFEVIQVRKKDETISNEKRALIINATPASAVLVIHSESDWTGNRTGPMIVVEPPTQGGETGEIPRWGAITPAQFRASLKLGRDIALALGLGTELSSLSDSRGLAGETTASGARLFCLPHQSLRYLTMPAVVITPLFLSSRSDVKKFSNDSAVSEFAAKVARGLSNFLQ